ncbi:MAG: cupin domain-containing protein [Acidobacteria bacterium]|nr:cupin domain-containing protein [Acidobacteriota bacterium]
MAMIQMDWSNGLLQPGAEVLESVKTLGQLDGLFADAGAWRGMDLNTVVYRVQAWCPIADGTEGGLFWGNTVIEPGQVGAEYFMTHGHFHRQRDRAEYYATISGEGALILMDENRKTWMEAMRPGSVHFIPPHIGHRTANTGKAPLHFVACWPSDAGHDYELIRQKGFGARLLHVDGAAKLVTERA